MITFDVTHVRLNGVDLIFVPVAAGFQTKPPRDQRDLTARLQQYAFKAGLAGTVVPVWMTGCGMMNFFAPSLLHPAVERLDWSFVVKHINCRILAGCDRVKRGVNAILPESTTAEPGSVATDHDRHRNMADATLETGLLTAC